ncbi:MAG: hypothetical protein QM831_18200 [Kofleriaceae bacterium]
MRALLLLALAGTANAEPVDLQEWAAAHGGAVPANVNTELGPSCNETEVGPRHEPAILCYTAEFPTFQLPNTDEPAYRVLDRYTVYVVRSEMLIALLDAPTRAGMLDENPASPGEEKSRFTIALDGMSIVVGDPSDKIDCRNANRKPKLDKLSLVDQEWVTLDAKLRAQICQARGTYVWKRGQFVRKA